MEVHHHPHVEKKSFKEYVLEGLMIFIAVSMGFIAENIREKIQDHEIVQRNIEIIIENLKTDTAAISRVNKASEERILALDSILTFQNKRFGDPVYFQTFIRLFRKNTWNPTYIATNEAYEQMKSSGNLRLIHNKEVLDSLFNYNAKGLVIKWNGEVVFTNSTQCVEDISCFISMQDNNKPSQAVNYVGNSNDILRFFNHCFVLKVRISGGYIRYLADQKKRAENLIKLLQEEYNIKDNPSTETHTN